MYEFDNEESIHDIAEYGGWVPWFFFDLYAGHWLLGAMVVGVGGFAGLLGMPVPSLFQSYLSSL
jgi:hypothetical protein